LLLTGFALLVLLAGWRIVDICGHVLLARLGWQRSRAPKAYVRELFDDYAENYDDHVMLQLRSASANLVSESLNQSLRCRPRVPTNGLDLGCGTGICGVLLANRVTRLTGVDLSPAMIGRAAERGVYDALYQGDLLPFLESRRRAWDLITAADVLVYLGDLERLIWAALGALRLGGVFIFTTESLVDEGFRLEPTGRYSHNPGTVARLALHAGFEVDAQIAASLRLQEDEPVAGHVHTLRKPNLASPG